MTSVPGPAARIVTSSNIARTRERI